MPVVFPCALQNLSVLSSISEDLRVLSFQKMHPVSKRCLHVFIVTKEETHEAQGQIIPRNFSHEFTEGALEQWRIGTGEKCLQQ